jgi:hypothetical protein
MCGVRPFVTLAVTAEDVGQFERRPAVTAYSGGVTCSVSRSSRLEVLAMTCVETRV